MTLVGKLNSLLVTMYCVELLVLLCQVCAMYVFELVVMSEQNEVMCK